MIFAVVSEVIIKIIGACILVLCERNLRAKLSRVAHKLLVIFNAVCVMHDRAVKDDSLLIGLGFKVHTQGDQVFCFSVALKKNL